MLIKKIKFFIFVFIFSSQAFSFSLYSFLNKSQSVVVNNEVEYLSNSNNTYGLGVGLFKTKLYSNVSFLLSVEYFKRSILYKEVYEREKQNLALPVLISIPIQKLDLLFGIYPSYSLGEIIEKNHLSKKNKEYSYNDIYENPLEIGLLLGLSFKVFSSFFMEIRSSFGLLNSNKASDKDTYKITSNDYSLVFGYEL